MITISVPKPLVIFGEYLEVFNQPSISIPTNNLVKYSFTSNPKPEIKISHYTKTIYQISKKIEKYLLTISPQKGLKITFPKTKVDPITFTVATVKAISDIYKLKFNKEQIFDACLLILSNLEINSVHLKAELTASIWQKTCFLDGMDPIPQVIKNKKLPLQIFKLSKNLNSEIFNKLNSKKNKYPSKFQIILDNFNYITNLAKVGFTNSDTTLIADNLNKYHKILDNLRMCDERLHDYFVSAILAGAQGLKYCTFFDEQYLVAIIPEKDLRKVKTSLSKLKISEIISILS